LIHLTESLPRNHYTLCGWKFHYYIYYQRTKSWRCHY